MAGTTSTAATALHPQSPAPPPPPAADEKYGEVVAAAVVLRPEASGQDPEALAAAIRAHAAQRLAAFKVGLAPLCYPCA